MMKRFTLRALSLATLMVCFSATLTAGWPSYPGTDGINGTNPYYVLNKSSEVKKSTIWEEEMNLNGPGSTLTFSAKREKLMGFTAGPVHVSQKVNGTYEEVWSNNLQKGTYQSFTVTLNPQATAIKFWTTTGATGYHYYKDVKVSMYEYLGATASTSLNFDSGEIQSAASTMTTTFDWSNTTIATPTITGDNADLFSVSMTNAPEKGKYGTCTVTVTYAHTTSGTHSASLKIGNSTIALTGSTYKKTQSLAWNAEWENSIVTGVAVGASWENIATATSGLAVTYTTDNTAVFSIEGNQITAIGAGTATITASQSGDGTYEAATPITKTFTVNALKVPVFWLNDDPDMTETNLFVGGTATIILDNVDASLQQTYDNTQISCAIEGNTLTVTALAAADATLTLSQPATSTIQPASRTFTFHISKNTATLTNNLNAEYKVDDVIALTDVYTNSNSEIEVTVTSTDENVLKVQDGQLVAVGAGTATITVAQAENYKYTPLSAEKTVTVSKYTNSIVVTLDGAAANSKSIYYGDVVAFTYTYGNTAIPVTLEQTAGADIATYNSENNTITASYLNGTATWTISQPEDYKYTAAEATVTINVAAAQETCGTLFTKADKIDVGVGSTSDNYTWSVANVAGTLSFEACKSMATAVGDLEIYACKAGNWEKIQTIGVGSLDRDSYKSFSYTLDPQVTGIRFKNAGSYTRHIQNLKVTRIPLYLTTSTSALTLPDNEVGGQTTATFDVSWNTCADLLNIVSSNPKFTVNTATINTDGGIGSATITVTYASDVVEDNATADITLYTTSQVVTVKATASTTKKSQTITWDLAETATTTDVITLSATAQAEVTFVSLNEDIATINADNTLNILQAGTVTLVATAAENEEYKEATLTKSITIELTVPTILTMPTFSDLTYGESLAYATLNGGTASVPGMFYILDDIEIVYEVGVHDVNVQFIPDNTTLYAMVDMVVPIQVNPAAQTITWDTESLPETLMVGKQLVLDATATSGLDVTYTIDNETLATLEGATLTAKAKGLLTITASQEGNENYLAAEPVVFTIEITDSVPTGMQTISDDLRPQVTKRLVNGQVIIQTPNAKYNVAGKKIE